MTKVIINKLLCRCIKHEDEATTPAKRKYWDQQFKRLNALAKKLGWKD